MLKTPTLSQNRHTCTCTYYFTTSTARQPCTCTCFSLYVVFPIQPVNVSQRLNSHVIHTQWRWPVQTINNPVGRSPPLEAAESRRCLGWHNSERYHDVISAHKLWAILCLQLHLLCLIGISRSGLTFCDALIWFYLFYRSLLPHSFNKE